MITQTELKHFLHYNLETGEWIWLVGRRGHAAGRKAGKIASNEYLRIKIKRVEYSAASLAWLYVYGHWPKTEIDHRDRNRANNKFSNLREATRSENCANRAAMPSNKFNLKGVCCVGPKYQAQYKKHGRNFYLGLFDTPEAAHQAYLAAVQKAYGEFAWSSE